MNGPAITVDWFSLLCAAKQRKNQAMQRQQSGKECAGVAEMLEIADATVGSFILFVSFEELTPENDPVQQIIDVWGETSDSGTRVDVFKSEVNGRFYVVMYRGRQITFCMN